MMTRIVRYILLCAVLVTNAVQARLTIQISEGIEGAQPITIVPFGWSGSAPLPEDIASVVAADLARSGRFAPHPLDQLPARPSEVGMINPGVWRKRGTEMMVVGRVEPQKAGFQVRFQLYDVLRGEQLAGYVIPVRDSARLRQAAHRISDIVYERLTGERGAFNTNIAYITVEGKADERQFRLAVADADGFNEQTILTSPQPLMSPAWSPEGKRLAYVSFEEGRPAVYVQGVTSGQRRKVADYPGLNSAPAWSPDGQRLALVLSKDGSPDIFIIELSDGTLHRVTRHRAIDTEPAWSPDGSRLLFTSDRGGRPQLYEIRVGARGAESRPQRLTFEGNYNARGSYSADGRHVAMLHLDRDHYRIGVLDRKNGNFRVVTRTRQDESPSFAPNGSMIIYATEINGRGVLDAVSIDGRTHHRLGLVTGDVREPAWSPFAQ